MENDELRSIGLLGYDEKTETWYIDTRDARRLVLNRQTLEGLVTLYNSIHSGNPLHLGYERSLARLEENNRRLSQTIRDLYLYIDRERRSRSHHFLHRTLTAIARRISHRS